jgi:tetratricopeptide (TPR) repeat protein
MMIKLNSPHRLVFVLSLLGLSLLSCSKSGPSKDELLAQADKHFAAGEYLDAEKGYREVLRLAPGDQRVERQLGLIYHEQGQFVQAYPLLKDAAEREPDNLEVQVKFGLAVLSAGDLAQARDIARHVLEKQPAHEEALLLLANAAVEQNDIKEAQKLIADARAKDNERSGYHLARAWLDLNQGNTAGAEREFKDALKLDSQSAAAYLGLATLNWRRNDLEAANQAFRTAAGLSPAGSPISMRYAEFKLQTGGVSEAKAMLEDIARKLPDHLPARVQLMKIACAGHQDEDCAARVQAILAQDPANYDATLQDGMIKLARGEAMAAIREYTSLLSNYSRDPQLQYQLALAYLLYAQNAGLAEARKAYTGAEQSLQNAVNLNPHFEQAVLALAKLKIDKGNPAAATDLLEPFIKDQPKDTQARYLLASAYLAQQKSELALTVYREMTELHPHDPEPLYRAATVMRGQQRTSEARRTFEKSLEISPFYLAAVEGLVDLDIAQKDFATALNRVQKQVDHDPKAAQPLALRGKIYLAQRDLTHTEADLQKAIELDPKLEPAYMLLAQLYVVSHRDDEAATTLTTFLERSKSAPILMQLARIRERLKQFDGAREAYEELLTVDANSLPALIRLASLYSDHLAQPDKASELAKKAHELAPNEPHIADTLGWILFRKGQYTDALPLLQQAAGVLGDRPEMLFHLGMAHYLLGHEEPARLALQKVFDTSADSPMKEEARQRLSILAIDVSNADRTARQQIEKYLNEQPNDPIALVRLAGLQEREGATDQAIKTYQKVLEANSSYPPGVRGLALLYAHRLPNESSAYDLLVRARAAYPQDTEVARMLGILSYQRQYYPRAVELLQTVVGERNDDAEGLLALGEAHFQLKHWRECKTTLDRVLPLSMMAKLSDDARREAERTHAECLEMFLQ